MTLELTKEEKLLIQKGMMSYLIEVKEEKDKLTILNILNKILILSQK